MFTISNQNNVYCLLINWCICINVSCGYVLCVSVVLSAEATLDARCFSKGFYLTGDLKGQMRVSDGLLVFVVVVVVVVVVEVGHPFL